MICFVSAPNKRHLPLIYCWNCVSAESGLFQVLFSVSQQDLLSRLMLFGSAATVDAVCHLNSWGRCSIPIHALQVGVRLHRHTHLCLF